jgi:hypothetical protein
MSHPVAQSTPLRQRSLERGHFLIAALAELLVFVRTEAFVTVIDETPIALLSGDTVRVKIAVLFLTEIDLDHAYV